MGLWWYANGDVKTGPLSLESLQDLVKQGKVERQMLVWCEGMPQWIAAVEADELKVLFNLQPPPLPQDNVVIEFPNTARRWPRFFARVFDLWLLGFILGWPVGMLLPVLSKDLALLLANSYWSELIGLAVVICIVIPLALVMDAAMHKLAGNTPGKALLGIKVVDQNGKRLGFIQHLSRNFRMWFSGLALWIPVANLFTLIRQSNRLNRGLPASYDAAYQIEVRAKDISWLRVAGFSVLFIPIALTGMTLSTADSSPVASQSSEIEEAAPGGRPAQIDSSWAAGGNMRSATPSAQDAAKPASYVWTNPVTGKGATIPSIWTHSVGKDDAGQPMHVFAHEADGAAVVFAKEHGAWASMDEYALAFIAATSSDMLFLPKDGSHFNFHGFEAWRGSGTMLTQEVENRLTVRIVRNGQDFWRVVSVQKLPHEGTDTYVTELNAALFDTIL